MSSMLRTRVPVKLRTIPARRWYLLAHLASLAIVFAFLVYVNRNQWFNADDWSPIAFRSFVGGETTKGVWDPFNNHWGTLTAVSYQILYALFGLHFMPYLILMVGFQVLAMHLLWRVLLRARVDPLVALVATTTFGVLASASNVLTQTAGLFHTGSMACGLAALLVAPDDGPLGWRDAVAGVLLVCSLMFFSGLGIPLVVIVGLRILLTRGAKATAAVLALPVAAYLMWLVTYGQGVQDASLREPLGDSVQKIPVFVWSGLTDSVEKTVGLAGIGAVVVVLVAVWVARRATPRSVPWAFALAAASGAIVYLVLITIGRSSLGPEVASAGRYVYAIIGFVVPVLALAASAGVSGRPMRVPVLVLVGGSLLLVQVSSLTDYANERAPLEQLDKRRIIATADVLRSGAVPAPAPLSHDYVPLTYLAPSHVLKFIRDDALPGEPRPTREDHFEARLYLQTSITEEPSLQSEAPPRVVGIEGATPTLASEAECGAYITTANAGTITLRFAQPASLRVRVNRTLNLSIALERRRTGVTTPPRQEGISRARQYLNVTNTRDDIVLTLPPAATLEACPAPSP